MFRTCLHGETQLMSEREPAPTPERASISESAGRRGTDDRRTPVDPAADPAPVSPDPDRESIHKGEDMLERVKPY